jgi:Leucine-rich repeat (LRR) protein
MAADDEESKEIAALKIQALGRGMIARKQDRVSLAQSTSPNRKAEAREERQRQLAEKKAAMEKQKPRTSGGLHSLCVDGILSLSDIQEALEDLGRSANGNSVVYRSAGLSGREIRSIAALSTYVHLQRLDISHNMIDSLQVLQHLPFLVYLDASHNRLTSALDFRLPPPNAFALPPISALREANLSCNNITAIDDLSHHRNLSVLDLSDNQITQINGIAELRLLTCLNLDHNAITSVDGVPPLPVKELGLASNEISSLLGLSGCIMIEVLRVCSNDVRSLNGIEHLKALRVLDASDNMLQTADDLQAMYQLNMLSSLQVRSFVCV